MRRLVASPFGAAASRAHTAAAARILEAAAGLLPVVVVDLRHVEEERLLLRLVRRPAGRSVPTTGSSSSRVAPAVSACGPGEAPASRVGRRHTSAGTAAPVSPAAVR